MLCLSEADLEAVLPMDAAIDAMGEAFAQLSSGEAVAPQRTVIPVGSIGTTLLMGAALPGVGLTSKTVSVFPSNSERGVPVTNGLLLVLEETTGMPIAMMAAEWITAWRTGAASGLATRLLSRADAKVLALIGAGEQARTQAIAVLATRPIELLKIHSRARPKADALAAHLQNRSASQVRVEVVGSSAEACEDADIVCTATTASEPVCAAHELKAGVHINAVGSFQPSMRELDLATIERVRVFVDRRESALEEAGELIAGVNAGQTKAEDWVELGELVADPTRGRRTDHESTLFKSVGQAAQDTAIAHLAVRAARERGIGTTIEL